MMLVGFWFCYQVALFLTRFKNHLTTIFLKLDLSVCLAFLSLNIIKCRSLCHICVNQKHFKLTYCVLGLCHDLLTHLFINSISVFTNEGFSSHTNVISAAMNLALSSSVVAFPGGLTVVCVSACCTTTRTGEPLRRWLWAAPSSAFLLVSCVQFSPLLVIWQADKTAELMYVPKLPCLVVTDLFGELTTENVIMDPNSPSHRGPGDAPNPGAEAAQCAGRWLPRERGGVRRSVLPWLGLHVS